MTEQAKQIPEYRHAPLLGYLAAWLLANWVILGNAGLDFTNHPEQVPERLIPTAVFNLAWALLPAIYQRLIGSKR